MSGLFCRFYSVFDGDSFSQTMETLIRCHIMSDLGLCCLPMTLLRVSGHNGLKGGNMVVPEKNFDTPKL